MLPILSFQVVTIQLNLLRLFQIASNAGVDASVVVNKVMEADDDLIGYDAKEDQYVNMMEAGIVDPTKVRSHAIK